MDIYITEKIWENDDNPLELDFFISDQLTCSQRIVDLVGPQILDSATHFGETSLIHATPNCCAQALFQRAQDLLEVYLQDLTSRRF